MHKKSYFIKSFKENFPNLKILDNKEQYTPYLKDWRNNYLGKALLVIFPKNNKDIQKIINLCVKYNISITTQGGNTSLCGGSVPLSNNSRQIIINMSNFNRIIKFDYFNKSITLESGCILKDVQELALKNNLFFPLSIASEGTAQIGGLISTNAGGVHVIRYGTMRDLVLGLEVILPSGKIINQLNVLRKANTNFDLKQLFIGSEGTLGIITKATLKLFQTPKSYVTCLVTCSDISQSINLLDYLRKNFNICAFEIINDITQEIYNFCNKSNPLPICGKWIILFEAEIYDDFNFDKLLLIFQTLKIETENIIIATNQNEREVLWSYREAIPLSEKQIVKDKNLYIFKHDISLPISNINAFLNKVNKLLLDINKDIKLIVFGHLGDGNLHFNVMMKKNVDFDIKIDILINKIVYNLVKKSEGCFSAEHGIGQLKKRWLRKYYDNNSFILAEAIKKQIDPNNIFNPGKIF